MKILLISPSPPPVGGIQSWTLNILDYSKHQESIELLYEDTVVKYRGILEIGIWKRIVAGIMVTIDVMYAVKKQLRKNKPEVIHLTSSASFALLKDYLIMIMAKKYKVPLIIHWHFGRIPDLAIKKNWEWYLMQLIIRKSAYSIVIDNHSYKSLIDVGFNHVANIANPVSKELANIALKYKNVKRDIEIGKVVFVGHVFVNKGVYELVEACIPIQKVRQLKLIGPIMDKVKTELENLARRRSDGKWLSLTGSKSSEYVFSEISTAEFLVLPSYTEGFPNVILEAMAMACPVIATNTGAVPEILNIEGNNPCGFCVPVKDHVTLKKSIEILLADKELGYRYGQNGLSRVLDNFTLDKIFKEYQAIWQNIAYNQK